MNIIHRDLKPENMILDKNLNLHLLDFGFASNENIHFKDEYRGTAYYMAPEIRRGETYDGKQIDVFSLGVIIFALVAGLFPFGQANPNDTYYKCFINSSQDSNGIKSYYWDII